MTKQPQPGDARNLHAQTRDIWEGNAAFWDGYVGAEGNDFHRLLVAPAQMRLLALRAGERVLELACGNGQFAREMARAGADVVATDFSPAFIARAKQHAAAAGTPDVTYAIVDATREEELLALGERSFDAAVCTMAMMDMWAIEPMLGALARLLRPPGRFVFSVTHPCFNTPGTRLVAEEDDRDGELAQTFGVKVVEYLETPPRRGIGIIGQPEPHYYFSRPLSVLLTACFGAGFVLDGLEEPAFAPGSEGHHAFSWQNFPQIPPVLVARVRLMA